MTRSFAHAYGSRIFSIVSSLVCGLISLWLVGKYLPPDVYGVVLVALTIMGYLPLLDGGFRTTINRSLLSEPDLERKQRLLAFGQRLYSWLGIGVIGVAAVVMAGYASTPTGRTSGHALAFFLTLSLSAALSFLGTTQAGLLLGLQSQAPMYALAGLNSWLNFAGLWVGLHFGLGIWAFPLSSTLGTLGVYPLAAWLIRQRVPEIRFLDFRRDAEFWKDFRRLGTDAWACFRSQVSILLLYSIDIVLVGLLTASPADAAIYGVLARIFSILRSLLVSLSEIAWPIIAQSGSNNREFNRFLTRMNAWTVGSVTGALILTLAPFSGLYLGANWTPPDALVRIMAARFFITGLATPAAYVLYGAGEFRAISRRLERELIAACVFGVLLGLSFGLNGVAWGFVLGTTFGTMFPMIRDYAIKTNERLSELLFEMWWRAAVAFAVSFVITRYALPSVPKVTALVTIGAIGFSAGMAVCFLVSLLRLRREITLGTSHALRKLVTGV